MHEIFIEAINQKLIVQLRFDSIEKGIIIRKCIPFDFGPSRRYKDGRERYHFYDLDSPEGKHNLSILPERIIDISLTKQNFEPKDYITWTPNWNIRRDWNNFS